MEKQFKCESTISPGLIASNICLGKANEAGRVQAVSSEQRMYAYISLAVAVYCYNSIDFMTFGDVYQGSTVVTVPCQQ